MKTEPKTEINGEHEYSECARRTLKRKMDYRALGHYLRQRREAVGLAPVEMAKQLKLSGAALSRLERGMVPWTSRLMNAYLKVCMEIASGVRINHDKADHIVRTADRTYPV